MLQQTAVARAHLKRFRTRQRAVGSAIALCALGALCALVVTACGSTSAASSSTTSSTTSTSTTTTSTGAASGSLTAYQNCLKKHGVNFAAGGFGGPGRGATGAGVAPPPTGTTGTGTRPSFTAAQQKAFSACASLRPSGAAGGPGGFSGGGANTAAFAKFQACLKKHGVQTGSTAAQPSSSSQAAIAACRSLLPAGGFGPGSGSSAGGGGANSATFAKYQACLKEHGVKTGASGQSASKLQAAITACRSLLPNNGAAGTTTATTTSG